MARRSRSLLLPALALLCAGGFANAMDAGPRSAVLPELDAARTATSRKDFNTAMKELDRLANAGNAVAQYRLGAMLLANPLAAPDAAKASVWLERSATGGEARAAYLLAVIAASATPADVDGARRWLARASEGGLEVATEQLKSGRLPMQFLPALDLAERESREAAMQRAALNDDVATLEHLVVDVPVTVTDAFGRQLLAQAALGDAANAAQWLLQHGAAVDARDHDGATVLLLAAQSPKGAVLEALLSAHADINALDARGNTALHLASSAGKAAMVSRLLAAGAAVDQQNADGDGVLDLALRADAEQVASALRAAGARSSRPAMARDAPLTAVRRAASDAYAGQSDLVVAATRRDPALLRVLLGHEGVTAAARNAALLAAADAGSTESAKVLLDAGASAGVRDSRGRALVDIAVEQDNRALLEQLVRRGAPLTAPGPGGVVPLVAAVSSGRTAAVDVLLAAGSPVDAADAGGRSLLCIAAVRGDAEILEKLLARGAKPAQRDKAGRDALACAAERGDAAMVSRLLAAGAVVGQTDGSGRRALAAAAANGDVATVSALLAAGAVVDAVSDNGTTALMRAVMSDHLGAVRVLLGARAAVNLRDRDGETALTLAARDASVEVVQALLAAGAEPNYRNANRANAGDIAQGLNRDKVAALLVSK